MAKINWEKGDKFSFGKAFGVVLDNDKALLFKDVKNRNGCRLQKGDVPKKAIPLAKDIWLSEAISLAMRAVITSIF